MGSGLRRSARAPNYCARSRLTVNGGAIIDGFPIFTSASGNGSPDRICFTYMDSGFETSCAFATHLRWYKQLFQATGEFDLIFVGTHRSRWTRRQRGLPRPFLPLRFAVRLNIGVSAAGGVTGVDVQHERGSLTEHYRSGAVQLGTDSF